MHYKIICRVTKEIGGREHSGIEYLYEEFPDIRRLAKHLNALVKRNPSTYVIIVQAVGADGGHIANVKFLRSEHLAQQWLTGYKERLLANAIEVHGMDLKWNSGLRKKVIQP